MLKATILALIMSALPAQAGLPPTQSQGSGDAAPVTTFVTKYSNWAVTHVGTAATFGTEMTGTTTNLASDGYLSVGTNATASDAGTTIQLNVIGNDDSTNTIARFLQHNGNNGIAIWQGGFKQWGNRSLNIDSNGSNDIYIHSSSTGKVGIGTNNPQAGVDIAMTGTSKSALLVPRDTVANRPSSPVDGMIRYASDTKVFEGRVNGAWSNFVSASAIIAPTTQVFTSTGTTTGYYFTVTSANATVGATYTNNGHTFTVLNTIVASTALFTSGALAPQASGTLTKSGGTGDATITFSAAVAMGTYTAPTSPAPLYLKIKMVGGGGGGSGASTAAANDGGSGTAGAPTYFGPNTLLVANGGGGSTGHSAGAGGGTGGTASISAPAITIAAVTGGIGGGEANTATSTVILGGTGGGSMLGFGGQSAGNSGGTACNGYGGGGGGAGSAGGSANVTGGGGGGGGGVEAIIPNPSATYVYAVGTNGANGNGGTGGSAGSNGCAGYLIVEEHYQ